MLFNLCMNKRAFVASGAFVVGAVSLAFAQADVPAKQGAEAKTAVLITHNLSEVRTGNYRLDHDHARVVWNVSHHGYSTFSAVFSDIQGNLSFDATDPTRSHIEATVNMNSVGTLLPDFDARLKGDQFFDTAKYPTATFKSTHIERTSANALRVKGDLTFLGVTKPVVLDATFNQAGDGLGPPGYRIGFDGRMVFKRTDHGMEASSIGDAVSLQIEAEFEPVGAKPAG
jgi:polyisoprenoid-binding protein YceI